jgi:hypothetical protein
VDDGEDAVLGLLAALAVLLYLAVWLIEGPPGIG